MTEGFNPTEWITTKEAAELTGYTPSYIREAISRGRLDAQKIGRDWPNLLVAIAHRFPGFTLAKVSVLW